MGNLSGTFTSYQYNGKSVVDYAIISENLITQSNRMIVFPPTHLSDHSPINMTMKLFKRIKIVNNCKPSQRSTKKQHYSRLRWDNESSLMYKQALRNPYVTSVIGSDVPWLECPACNALTWVITVNGINLYGVSMTLMGN